MSLPRYLLLPLLFLSEVVLYSTQVSRQHWNCALFTCGRLGAIGYPFFRNKYPRCGVIAMNCTASEPKAQFHEKGKWYPVNSIDYLLRRIEVHDEDVQSHLVSNRCELLDNFSEEAYLLNFTEQLPPLFVSFNITKTRPFYKCKHEPSTFFNQFALYSCTGYDRYYNNQEEHLPSLPGNFSKKCSVVHLPPAGVPSNNPNVLKNNLTLHWGANFTINWKVLPACRHCFAKGGECQSTENKRFKCSTDRDKSDKNGQCLENLFIADANVGRMVAIVQRVVDWLKNQATAYFAVVGTGVGSIILTCTKKGLMVAVGFGAAAGTLFLTFVAFIVYRRHKRNRSSSSSSLISRDLSCDNSLKPAPEKGHLFFETKLFTYKELDEATNHFDSNKELGDGGFGTVYYGKLCDGRVVAVKRLFEHNYKRVEQFMNEIEILSRLRHQNLVSLYGCTSCHSRELLLVYEFVPNGTVADHLHGESAKEGLLTWPIRRSIAIQSADALTYLHASEIIHRDVKTNNILLDNNFQVKVADFGLSRLFPTDVTHVSTAPQGTPGYVDPEYYQCYQLTSKSDVYSFGVVLIELISSKPAVDIGRHRHEINLANLAVNKIHNQALHELVDPSLGYDTDYSVRNMITSVAELDFRCLQQENEMRLCMTEVLEILRGIENEEYKKTKTDDMDTSAVARLLKKSEPLSPDTVTGKWPSKDSTPNVSG